MLVCGICLLIPAVLIALLSKESAIIAEGQTALRLLALSYPLTGVAIVTAAAFQSVGRAREALLLTLGGIILVKLPVLLLASRLFSLTGIWASEASSELIRRDIQLAIDRVQMCVDGVCTNHQPVGHLASVRP